MRGQRRPPEALALVAPLLLLVAGVPFAASAHGPSFVPSPAGSSAFLHPPGVRPAGGASSGYWYTQEGGTLSEENGSTASGQLSDLVEQITLVTSPYPIGYELNGLSTRGDWYQVLVTDNWAGCNAGFEMTYELWDNTGTSATPVCDPNISLSAGDVVQLSLSFPSTSQACLDASDLTTGHTENDCMSQPDSGARGFTLLGSASNSNGYFTGPMTEIANSVPSSCPDYTNMPVVDYRWPSAFHVTSYYPFSDEFEYGGAGTYCYSSSNGAVSLAPGDPSSHFVDTASGTSYGPHYVTGQNLTYLDPSYGWRLVTDASPMTGVTVAPTSGTLPLGSRVQFNATVTGGSAPRSALWAVDGAFNASRGLQFNWTASTSGTHTIAAYGIDGRDLVNGPASSIIDVPGILSAGPVTISTSSRGADVGQSIVLSSQVDGGLPPYQFLWSGLPVGCSPSNAPSIDCVPTATGSFSVGLSVTDSNSSRVSAAPLPLTVSPQFSAGAAGSRSSLDVGQTFWVNVSTFGGRPPVQYRWSGVPSGCSVPATAVGECSPTDPGVVQIDILAMDSNGVEVNVTPGVIQVVAAPVVLLSADRVTADAGVPVVLTAQSSGGAGPLSFAWWGLPDNCTPTSAPPAAVCRFPAGTWEVGLNVSDANGFVAAASPVQLGIFPALQAAVSGGGTVVVGDPVSLAVAPSGGDGAVSYVWQNLPPGCSPPSDGTLRCTPAEAGQYNVTVILTDGAGGRISLVAQINVTAPTPAPVPGDSTGLLVIGVILAGVAALVVATLIVASRRRRA